MKNFLRKIATTILAVAVIPMMAQQRTEAEAEAIAKAFMQNNGYDFNITKSSKIKKVRTAKNGDITPYYIFNDTQNGGFVIVGGQEAMSDILAYSDEECFDVDNIPPAAQMWLEHYANVAEKATENPEAAMAEKKAAAKRFKASKFTRRQHVSPLLGEIKYNQGEPYNILCPELTRTTIKNGETTNETGRTYTGDTQTAQAMLMRYWKWPVRPTGEISYTFKYDSIFNQYDYTRIKGSITRTINFDEEPPYDWENMLPRYGTITRDKDENIKATQDTAVARLMMHLGFANRASYGLGGTSAELNYQGLVDYFGYANDYISDSWNNYNGDIVAYKDILADELSAGRPIWAAGNDNNDLSHSYICDGYDMNGLFHFNLGWGGVSNGYYEICATPTLPYGYDMYFVRNVHPIGRNTPSEPTRRVVMEAGLGEWNARSNTLVNAWKALTTDNKYGESIICIVTADTEEAAEAYLPGLSLLQGFMLDRSITYEDLMAQTKITTKYQERYNTPSPAAIDVDARYTSENTMAVTAYANFYNSHSDADYRFAFVYTEDNVDINGATYNWIARGMYPNKYGYENSLPTEIEYDKEYIYIKEIPIPESINNTGNTTLVVMLIDGKTGTIVNANTIDLLQVDTWTANTKGATDFISFETAEAHTGTSITLSLKMNNPTPVSGLQANFVLPEGVTVSQVLRGEGIMEKNNAEEFIYTFENSVHSDGSQFILCYSTENTPIAAGEVEIAKVIVNVAEDAPVGYKAVTVKNIEMSYGSEKIMVPEVSSTLKIYDYTIGDANGDGSISVTDITTIAGHLMSHEVTINTDAADVNRDGNVSVSDISMIGLQLLSGAKAKAKAFAREFFSAADIKIVDVKAKAGENVTIPVTMTGIAASFQFDVYAPEGVTIATVKHGEQLKTIENNDEYIFTLQAEAMDGGLFHRIIGYNMSNTSTKEAGEIVELVFDIDETVAEGDYEIKLKNIECGESGIVLSKQKECSSNLNINGTTGIDSIASDTEPITIYTLQGAKVSETIKGKMYIFKYADGKTVKKIAR